MSSRLCIALATVVFALRVSTDAHTARAQQKPSRPSRGKSQTR